MTGPRRVAGDGVRLGLVDPYEGVPTAGEQAWAKLERGTAVEDDEVERKLNDTRLLNEELARQRRQREAASKLRAEQAPPLRLLGLRDFLDSPRPEPLVPGVFYRNSLSRIFGAPGCGKSFLALDLALSIAVGRTWRDAPVRQGRVVYAMAEGQAINVLRLEAWCERNRVSTEELVDRFFAVPDAVPLTEEGVSELVTACERLRPELIILDTKNSMMVGEENSATDTATMRRALDLIRKASGGCVTLIDHSGHEGTRARGSSAATAAMDSELRVTKEDVESGPSIVTAEVTRDKGSESGLKWQWHLRVAGESAVLVPADLEVTAAASSGSDRQEPAWKTAPAVQIPEDLRDFAGRGAVVMEDLARFLAHDASPQRDAAVIGVSRAEAIAAMRREGYEATGVRRAWSFLVANGFLSPVNDKVNETGRHRWFC